MRGIVCLPNAEFPRHIKIPLCALMRRLVGTIRKRSDIKNVSQQVNSMAVLQLDSSTSSIDFPSYPYFSSSSLKKRPPHWFKHQKKLCDSIGRRSGN